MYSLFFFQEFEKIKTAYQRSESCIHLLEERVNSLTQSLQAARDDAMERGKQLNKINEIEAMFQTKINNHNASEQSTIMDLEKCRWNSDDLKEIQKFM